MNEVRNISRQRKSTKFEMGHGFYTDTLLVRIDVLLVDAGVFDTHRQRFTWGYFSFLKPSNYDPRSLHETARRLVVRQPKINEAVDRVRPRAHSSFIPASFNPR